MFSRNLLRALLACFIFSFTAALGIRDFLGDEPLTIKRIVQETIDYFKEDDPHGIPVLEVPEPLDIAGPVTASTIILHNLSISGQSQLRLDHVDINLEKCELEVKISIPLLEILAENYTWPGYWSSSEGKMNVTFTELQVGIKCQLGISDEGQLEVTNFELLFDKDLFIPTFTGLTAVHSITVSAADTFLDSVILPIAQARIADKGITKLNERLNQRLGTKLFPVDISPVDFAIAFAKKEANKVIENGIDPLPVKDQEINVPNLPMSIIIKNTVVRGLSTIHRTKLIRAEFVDNRLYVTIELGTQNLKASTDWSLYSSVLPLYSGHSDIYIDSFKISLEAQQDADIRHPPIMRFVDVELGNIALRSEGERNIDYALEALVNLLPNIVRNVALDKKIEGTIKKIAQKKFNTINWEHIIYDKLEKIDTSKVLIS